MEKVQCDLCGCDENKLITSQTDLLHNQTDQTFDVVKCVKCNLVFTNPRPKKEDIGNYYSKNYYAHKNSIFRSFFVEKIKFILTKRIILLLVSYIPFINNYFKLSVKPKIENPILPKKNIIFLDIGCGTGEKTHIWGPYHSVLHYQKFSDNIYAVEPDIAALKKLKDKKIKAFSSIHELPNEVNFDVIRMNWSLEHVHSPDEYFQFIKNNLKNDGSAIICVPNFDGQIYLNDPSMLELPVHLFHFTPETINKYCQKHGLKMKKCKTFSYASMYYYASTISKKLGKYINYSLRDLLVMQLKFDNEEDIYKGNDMVCVIKKI